MDDLKDLMEDHFLKYASYVILDRAIPDVQDGLKPVQRRILHTLWKNHDGKLHKVANIVGQTMAYHPHGDAAISDALVNLANKGFLMDRQGNFGNLYTGDPAAASRYIETRLSPLAIETLFNPDLTQFIPSYDGRNDEPVLLPAKIPLLLMQGSEGIAVGMATKIFPHNFVELLEAQIAILEKKPFTILPDFPTGGTMDASQYDLGRGKVKVRARIEVKDPKTIVILDICPGTNTESVTRSIDEAAKRGKIKIDSINDYTAEKVEIEIKLPRGQYAEELIPSLYAYTDCEVSLNSQVVVINNHLPCESDIESILHYNVEQLKELLKLELEIERDRLLEKIFNKTLEQIFIENRLYKKIEDVKTYEQVHEAIEKGLKPFHKKLERVPTYEDRERLLAIPIRRISRFDMEKNQDDIRALGEKLVQVEKDLKQIKKVTIRYLRHLIKTYGKFYPRMTKIQTLEAVDKRTIISQQKVKVCFDAEKGMFGTKIKGGEISFTCSPLEKVLVLYRDGTYQVLNIPEKQYLPHKGSPVVYVGLADKETPFYAVYRNPKTRYCFAKQFIVKKFILEKEYRFFEEGMELQYLSTKPHSIKLQFVPKAKQKTSGGLFDLSDTLLKGVSAKGIRMATRPVRKISWNGSKGEEDPQMDLFKTSLKAK